MPTAHLIHGYLGVGKTTFACQLEEKLPAIRFTHDEWMQRLYGEDPPEAEFADYKRRVFDLMETVWSRCLRLGIDVVLDWGFWGRSERDRIRTIISALGADARLYRLTCRDDEAWHRIEKRNGQLGQKSLYIAPNTYQVLRARFEPLSDDEQRVEIHT